ncbi:MAG: hypothetical protein U0797_22080 [Gemmataceae bacterium]
MAPDTRTDEHEMVAGGGGRRTASTGCWSTSSRAAEIIRMRAGLDSHAKGMTLEEVGQAVRHHQGAGATAERQAMKKLRTLAEKQDFDTL